MWRSDKPGIGQPGMVTAQEVASFAYCPESWRLEKGLGLEAGNRAALEAGTRHRERKAVAGWSLGRSSRMGHWPVHQWGWARSVLFL